MFRNSVIWLTGIACVKKEIYTAIVQCLRDAVRRKYREKWRTNSRFLLHDNAPVYRSVTVKGFFLTKNNLRTVGYLPDSLGLAPADFYLFARLISALKRRSFCDATAIVKDATEDLIRLSQNGFQECLQHLCSCWQKHNGLYFSKRSLKDCNVLYLSEIKWFREHFETTTYKTYTSHVFKNADRSPHPRIQYPRFQLSAVSVIRGLPMPEKNWKIREINGS